MNELSIVDFKTKTGEKALTGVAIMAGAGGKAAQLAVKDNAIDLALSLALKGRYRPAAEILADSFKTQYKHWEKANGDALPWANKATFESFVTSMGFAKPPAKGWPTKAAGALGLLRALSKTPPEVVTIENQVTEVA